MAEVIKAFNELVGAIGPAGACLLVAVWIVHEARKINLRQAELAAKSVCVGKERKNQTLELQQRRLMSIALRHVKDYPDGRVEKLIFELTAAVGVDTVPPSGNDPDGGRRGP